MSEALSVLVGEEAKGLSANVVSRRHAQWAEEHAAWNRRSLSGKRYVYWWVDGIHTGLRAEESSDGQCLLVIIGVTPEGRKERVAIGDGLRESKASWRELLLDLKARGLQHGPLLAVADGVVGGAGGGVSGQPGPALLVPQDGQCAERTAEIAARQGQGGDAGDLDGRDARGGEQGL